MYYLGFLKWWYRLEDPPPTSARSEAYLKEPTLEDKNPWDGY